MGMKSLYFLTHEGKSHIFSGYGIPLKYGEKSPLIGMLMVDRPVRCPEEYLQKLRDTFGELFISPMTHSGERGVFAQMRIEDPFSLDLLQDVIYGPKTEHIAQALELSLRAGYSPKPRLKLRWSRDHMLWLSEFDI